MIDWRAAEPQVLLEVELSLINCWWWWWKSYCMPARGGRWQKAANKKRLCLAKIPNTYFYHDPRPELRTTKVANIRKTRRCPSISSSTVLVKEWRVPSPSHRFLAWMTNQQTPANCQDGWVGAIYHRTSCHWLMMSQFLVAQWWPTKALSIILCNVFGARAYLLRHETYHHF